jgi:hypothetical protein
MSFFIKLFTVGATLCGCPGQTRRSAPTIRYKMKIISIKYYLPGIFNESIIGHSLFFNTLRTDKVDRLR